MFKDWGERLQDKIKIMGEQVMNIGNNVNISNSSIISGGSNIQMGNGYVKVNGKEIKVPKGSSVSVVGKKIYIDGKLLEAEPGDYLEITVIVEGDATHVESDSSVVVKGNVKGRVSVRGSLDVGGNVDGSISAVGSVNIEGSHSGSISAGGSVCTGR